MANKAYVLFGRARFTVSSEAIKTRDGRKHRRDRKSGRTETFETGATGGRRGVPGRKTEPRRVRPGGFDDSKFGFFFSFAPYGAPAAGRINAISIFLPVFFYFFFFFWCPPLAADRRAER